MDDFLVVLQDFFQIMFYNISDIAQVKDIL